jgi:hypothetical protein
MTKDKMQCISEFWREEQIDALSDANCRRAKAPIINQVMGIVESHHVGFVRAGVRIRVIDRTDLRVKWSIVEERLFIVGQRVVAIIPAEAVRLEAGIFRRSKQRWNRWIGRIVLVESGEAGILYTVKIHGEDWTLKGYGPVTGVRQPGKVWDVVNVVVDPQRVDLTTVDMKSWRREADLMMGLKEY